MLGLDRRIELLEKKLMPQLTHLVVMLKPGELHDAAIKRTVAEQGITALPDDCFIIALNLHKNTNRS